MDNRSLLGVMHAEEALLISIVRSLPQDVRDRIANDFQEQVEIAEASHVSTSGDRETDDAFKTHLRRLSNLLAALS